MAQQHFYSRVPARISMYSKSDNFDTFIKSTELDEKYINDSIMPICNIKLTNNELKLIRDGKLSPAYAQFFNKSGVTLIQSAISYIPLDFTGERSSYMINSLVFNPEEQVKITTSNRNGILNPKLFNTNINSFDIMSKDVKPIEDAEEVEYVGEKCGQVESFFGDYPPTVVKRLLYALLQSITPKGKYVYLTLNVPIEELSSKALDFINNIIQVFPYSFRNKFSFITFLCDINRYPFIKVKFLPKDCINVTAGKGYQFDMTNKVVDGIRDEEYKARETEINFLYDLLSNKPVRDKFLNFYGYIVSQNPKLEVLDLKDFSSIVFLFRQSNEEYDEKFVIPDDNSVYNLLLTYENFRNYMKEKDRCEIVKCIQRYATKRVLIPQNIFTKITKLYKTEEVKCKTTIMAIILELIHTDVMRDKLFSFIKSNYSKEIQRNRSIISEDLSRVFYGGFLQPQILELYNTYFETETLPTKNIILEKLLLAIRTNGIQDKILEFLDTFYQLFTNTQKEMIYKTFYEHVIENDDLTKKIFVFINSHYDQETLVFKKKISENIIKLVEADEKKKNKEMLNIIIEKGGPLERILIKKIFTDWSTRAIFSRYIASIQEFTYNDLCDNIIKVLTNAYTMQPQVEKKIYEVYSETFDNLKNLKLYQIIDFDENMKNKFLNDDYAKINEINDQGLEKIRNFYNRFKENSIKDAICSHLLDALNVKLNTNGIEYVLSYSESNKYLKNCENYSIILLTSQIVSDLKEGKVENVIESVFNTSLTRPVKILMGEYLKSTLLDVEKQAYLNYTSFLVAITLGAVYQYLEKDTFILSEIFDYCFEKRRNYLIENDKSIQSLSKKEVNYESLSSSWTIEYITKFSILFVKHCENETLTSKINNTDNNELYNVVYNGCKVIDKDGMKQLNQLSESLKVDDVNISSILTKALNDYKKDNPTGFLSRLFKKKK